MKRNSAEASTSSIISFTKCKIESSDQSFGQVFTIAKINNDSEHLSDKLRVGVSSKVNFSKLTSKEQLQRFQNQAQEIRKLRRKLSKVMHCEEDNETCERQKTIEHIKSFKYELDDQKFLLENLVKGISERTICPGTLAYNQICTILRDALQIKPKNPKYTIKLGESDVAISTLEYKEYSKLPCTPGVLQVFTGREQMKQENYSELLRALNIQEYNRVMKCLA